MLGADYVDYCSSGCAPPAAPSCRRAVAVEGFATLDHRPEEMIRALGAATVS